MSILLRQLTKRYAGQPVVNQVSLEVGDGEFFVLLGSSGSGKTTILNLIAGLIEVDQGQIILRGREVTRVPTQQRRVGFVFQNYALFQHLSVRENVEFGLAVRKVRKVERRRRRDELLELVGLAGMGERMPRQLSGGEQQRVALARALAAQPEVLLLDEPLGALDAKIRGDLRRSLRDIQRRLRITTILVTHDQEEAFDLADRIGVMSRGRLVEVGSPEELYLHPQTEFVATFLGTANLLVGNLERGEVVLGKTRFPGSQDGQPTGQVSGRAQVLFRPEDVVLAPSEEELGCPVLGVGQVSESNFAGAFERLRLQLPAIPGVRPIAPEAPFGSRAIQVEATRLPEQSAHFPLQQGSPAWVGVRRIHALAHPGLNFLIISDGTQRSAAAVALGGEIALTAHARVTLLGVRLGGSERGPEGSDLQEAGKQFPGLTALQTLESSEALPRALAGAVEAQVFDLVVMGFLPGEDLSLYLAEQALQTGNHHLLLVPPGDPSQRQKALARSRPEKRTRALICVSIGEPGKEDILFTGRLIRHLGAEAVLVSVIPAQGGKRIPDPDTLAHAAGFLERGVETLGLLDVPAHREVRCGPVRGELIDELNRGGYDLLVLGTPIPGESGSISLRGLLGQILSQTGSRPVLLVRHSSS
ncbi:MAG TPA: ATP-binding cassette domain-containing protein [Anaerolineaceae bacterium]|nr:ATP-binding cassette domain-containing protein [Anaerolineaceae bacterium]